VKQLWLHLVGVQAKDQPPRLAESSRFLVFHSCGKQLSACDMSNLEQVRSQASYTYTVIN
jgi:hypothetical protein